jgi:hypothetical protein
VDDVEDLEDPKKLFPVSDCFGVAPKNDELFELPELEPFSALCIASKPAFLANGSEVLATHELTDIMLLFSP